MAITLVLMFPTIDPSVTAQVTWISKFAPVPVVFSVSSLFSKVHFT